MKAIKIIFVIILIMNFYSSSNAEIKVNLIGLYSPYDMEKVKKANDDIVNNLTFPAKITDSYPNRPGYSVELTYIFSKLEFGISYTRFSSGGRIHYSDYLSEYKLDNIINQSSIGAIFRIPLMNYLNKEKGFLSQFIFESGITNINSSSTETTIISIDKKEKYLVITKDYFYVKLGMGLDYKLYNFVIGPELNYFILSNETIGGRWNGFRGAIKLGYILHFEI